MTQIAEVERQRSVKSRRPRSRQGMARPVRPTLAAETFRIYGRTRRRFGILASSFMFCVVVPTLVLSSYFIFVAPEEYLTEAKVVVRAASEDNTYGPAPTAQSAAEGLLGQSSSESSTTTKLSTNSAILAGGKTAASPEIYMIGDYIRSRTIIQDLGGKELLRRLYREPKVDWFSRLPWPISLEDAWDYWNNKVRATVDTQADILTLSVRAFTREDSLTLAQSIIKKSEQLLNVVSEASRNDALTRAESEIQKTRIRLAKAQAALKLFRDTSSSVNPMLSATSVNDTITQLMKEKIDLETNRNSLEGMVSADSPTRRLVDAQIAAKEKQIKELQAQLTSQKKDDAISGKIAKFEELELEKQFAQNLYSTAQTAYQQARVELNKQQLYLSLVATPTMPEEAAYPRKVLDSALSFAFFLVVWGMLALAGAAIRDHVDYSR